MARYAIEETVACGVTYSSEVEADNAQEALRKHNNGERLGETVETIGDSIDYEDTIFEVAEIRCSADSLA